MDVSSLPPTNLSPSVAEHRARIVTTLEEAQQLIQSNTQRAQLKMKGRYDQSARSVPYTIGQRVWVYSPKHRKGLSKKLLHNYHGLYRIVGKLSPVHFKLRTLENKPVNAPIHANRLKPFFDPKDRPIEAPQEDPPMGNEPYLNDDNLPTDNFPSLASHTLPPSSHPDDAAATEVTTSTAKNADQIYDAEQIVCRRVRHGKLEYFIKWRGYAKRYNIWEPPDHISDERLWTDFYHRYPEHRPTTAIT